MNVLQDVCSNSLLLHILQIPGQNASHLNNDGGMKLAEEHELGRLMQLHTYMCARCKGHGRPSNE